MGHGTVRAALIYQRATTARDRKIADALDALMREQRQDTAEGDENDEGRT